ncbi:GroES-like protein [Nemania abortiva]|nr:GroES-like protein [Nemania abortiva]
MAIPKTMLAAQFTAYNNPYEIRTIPVPQDLEPYDVLIKVAVASHCHTDFNVCRGNWGSPLPCTGSHEGAGTVAAVGSAVKPEDLKVGDRVMGGMLLRPCGTCYDCTGPETNRQYCMGKKGFPGVTADGFYAEYVLVDARHTAKLPEGVDMVSASPLACAGRTVWRALKIAALEVGQTVAIVGAGGGLGHLAIQFAKAWGLRVIALDVRDEALTLCRDSGADVVLDARNSDAEVISAVQAATGGLGAHSTINMSFARESVALSCAITRMHCTVIQVAEPEMVEIPPDELVFRDIRIRSTLISSGDESREMLKDVVKHTIKVETQLFRGLDKLPELLKMAKSSSRCGRLCLVIDEEQLNI